MDEIVKWVLSLFLALMCIAGIIGICLLVIAVAVNFGWYGWWSIPIVAGVIIVTVIIRRGPIFRD